MKVKGKSILKKTAFVIETVFACITLMGISAVVGGTITIMAPGNFVRAGTCVYFPVGCRRLRSYSGW